MMDSPLLAPFAPVLLSAGGVAAVLGGYFAVRRWQRSEAADVIEHELDIRREERKREIAEVVTAAFTGRAEADVHRYNDLAARLRDSFRDALVDHEARERQYADSIRDKVVEYHQASLAAIEQAKRLSVHVSSEYHELRRRVEQLATEIEGVKNEMQSLERALNVEK